MKRLEELPYRFWPARLVPEGAEVPTKVVNLKAEKFKPAYTRVVNPVLKGHGFRCTGTTAVRLEERLWVMVWSGAGKYGGSGEVVIAAHLPGLPARSGAALEAREFTYYRAMCLRSIKLTPEQVMFDYGHTPEEGLETAGLMAEAFAEQGPPYLEALAQAEERLLAVEVGGWVEQMTALYQTLSLRLVEHTVPVGSLPLEASAELLARLHARAGHRAEARAFAEAGLAAAEESLRGYRHAWHTTRLRLEKLVRGEVAFVLDAADRAEVDARVAAEKAAGPVG
ncbi:MAG: hypothetical protein H6706_31025 [Myxococcales bacterium]|nr:hypothetical protein [Myxococcales bacterium]